MSPIKKISKYSEINHTPYFRANGHTGNSTIARTKATPPIKRPLREIVVSNLNEQNLGRGSGVYLVIYSYFGYFKFLLFSNLLK